MEQETICLNHETRNWCIVHNLAYESRAQQWLAPNKCESYFGVVAEKGIEGVEIIDDIRGKAIIYIRKERIGR